jgi:hypothetical protein
MVNNTRYGNLALRTHNMQCESTPEQAENCDIFRPFYLELAKGLAALKFGRPSP